MLTEESKNQVMGMSNMSPCSVSYFFYERSIVSDYRKRKYADTISNRNQNVAHYSLDSTKFGEVNQNPVIGRIPNQRNENSLARNDFIFSPEGSTSNENQSRKYADNVSNCRRSLPWEDENQLQYYRQDFIEINTLLSDIQNTWDHTHSLDFQYNESFKNRISLNSNIPHPIERLNQPPSTEPEIKLTNEAIDPMQRVREVSLAENQECPVDSAGPSTKNIYRSQPVPEYLHHTSSTLDTSDNSFTDLYSREGNSRGNFRNISESPQQCERYSKHQKETGSVQNCPIPTEFLTISSAAPTIKKVYNCWKCGAKFKHKSLLQSHIENPKEHEYKCNQCPKEFKFESWLSKHKKVHSDQKPFGCNYCDRTFKRKSTLTIHIKTCH